MKLIAIGTPPKTTDDRIEYLKPHQLTQRLLDETDYLIVSGGDGTLRRSVAQLARFSDIPPIIFNPTGSFNVMAKVHRIAPLEQILQKLKTGEKLGVIPQDYYRLNDEIFLFSAGNMGDLHHIFLAESLRFGWLKNGSMKYLLALILLLPLHMTMTPFMLASKQRFFIFTPFSKLKKLGSFYGSVPSNLHIDLENAYNFIELDGDIVPLGTRQLEISHGGKIALVIG